MLLSWSPCPSGAPEGEQWRKAALVWLEAYFAGNFLPVAFPLAPAGTPFQQRVWHRLLEEVPVGTVVTYGELARTLGSGARAVGGAVGANPLPLIIPCHRVVGARGPGGYSGAGGVVTKRWLLAHEGMRWG